MSIVFTSFKNPKLPISIKISGTTANCLYLHDSFISKFEFMNYLFANLLVAWLYIVQILKIETKVADQIARTCRLVCAFVVRMQQNLFRLFRDEAQFRIAISLQIY